MTVGVSSANFATVILNWIRGTNATAPTNIFVKLHISAGDPGAAGANNAAAGDTTRKGGAGATVFSAPAANAIALAANLGPWTNGGTSETLGYISSWDASSAGNFLWSAQLASTQAWASTNTFTLTTLGVSISPIAA
jgi:hypothetical protein